MTGRDELVSDVARELVSRLAPEEIPLFPATSRAFFAAPARHTPEQLVGPELAPLVVLMTPVILSVVAEVAKQVSARVGDAATRQGADALHRLFHRPASTPAGPVPDPSPRLTAEQLAEIRRIAVATAIQMHLPEDRANLLAEAIVGSLASGGDQGAGTIAGQPVQGHPARADSPSA
jgi:hypothetical protein